MLRLQLHRSETAMERSTHTQPVTVADNQPARLPPPEIEKLQDDLTAQNRMAVGGTRVHGDMLHFIYCKFANACANMAHAQKVCK